MSYAGDEAADCWVPGWHVGRHYLERDSYGDVRLNENGSAYCCYCGEWIKP